MGVNKPEGSPSPSSLDIVVVDDEPVITLIVQTFLRRAGHRVVSTNTSEQAAELLKAGPFDLLITDKNMPGMSGVELCRLARARQPSIMIMMITAFSNVESASALRQVGADDYLEKPIDFEHLIARIEELRQRRRSVVPTPWAGARVALIALTSPELARFSEIIRQQGGIAVAVDDIAAALAAPLAADLVVVSSRLITRDTTRAIWRTRVERPGLGIVLLSNGGLADEMAGISVGTRVLLSPTLDDVQTEALLRSALGLTKSP